MSTAFHLQTDGQRKRMNQTLKQYFKLFTGKNKHKWVDVRGPKLGCSQVG